MTGTYNFQKKVGYYVGAVADFIFGIVMFFFPNLTHFIWGIQTPPTNIELFWMRYFGIIVFCWGILLLWGSRKPVEKRMLLLCTAFPTVSSFILLEVQAYFNGIMNFPNLVLLAAVQMVLCTTLLFSYYVTGKVKR